MNNGDQGNQTHRRMNLRQWEGGGISTLSTESLRSGMDWDNHHWSNHKLVIAAQVSGKGLKGTEAGLVLLPEGRLYLLTDGENVEYPDIWVRSVTSAAPVAIASPERAQAAEGERTLDAKLLAKVTLPADLDYRDALVLYEYESDSGERLHVVHRALRDRETVGEIVGRRPGQIYALHLRPFAEQTRLKTLYLLDRSEDLLAPRWWDGD
jgi:hypothetical protein